MSQPSLSVVIPTYNRWPLLKRAVSSVLNQTIPASQVIVVDDGSTDGTAQALSGFAKSIRVIRIEGRRGAPHARNVGIDASRDRFVALLDSDDEWLPTYLEKALSLLERDDKPLAVCSAVIQRSRNTEIIVRPSWSGSGFEELISFRTRVSPAIVFERHRARDARFDESLPAMQEHDFLVSLSRRGAIICSPEPLCVQHADGGHRITNPTNHLSAHLLLLEKYKAELGRRPVALANHYYKLAHVYRRLGDNRGVMNSLKHASLANPTDRRLRMLASAAELGPATATAALRTFLATARAKESVLRLRRDRRGASYPQGNPET